MAESYSFQAQGPCLEKQAVVVIQNNGSRTYQVNRLAMEPRMAVSNSSSLNYLTLSKITDLTVAGGLVYPPVARRSNSTDIASAITIVSNPSSVTLGATLGYGNLAAVQAGSPKFNENSQFAVMHNINQNRQLRGVCFGDILKSCCKGQPITLAAGEGIVFSQFQVSTTLGSYFGRTSVEVELVVGGATYSTVVPVGSHLMTPLRLAVFNEVGSGVSCEITRICEVQDNYGANRTLHTSPTYGQPCIPQLVVARMAKTKRYDYVNGGNKTVPVVGMESGGAGETELTCFIGTRTPDITVFGEELQPLVTALQATGFPPNSTALHQRAVSEASAFRALPIKDAYFRSDNSTSSIGVANVRRGVVWEANRGVGLCIAPGEAIVVRSVGSDYLDAVIGGEISVIPSATYPAVGDVDLGIQYGPNATDYTGTLVQPAINQVLSGVGFGADGTEFTGTATGGGGGNTYSRGRITNA